MTSRRLRRYVEDLLRGRRPRAFRPNADEAADVRTAISLRAARPGSGAPSEEFVTGLHRRLAAELAPESEVTGPARPSRRRAVQVASAAAAGVALGAAGGAALDRVIAGAAAVAPLAEPTLEPNVGSWHTVAAVADLPDGAVRGFDVGTVTGFVGRTADGLRAVSGICTHLGCRLALDVASSELLCPCHNAAFAVTGELVHHQLATPPPPLPRITVREAEGAVQIFAP
jgi:cytochrome b6-f complex iron-sulfur subunit